MLRRAVLAALIVVAAAAAAAGPTHAGRVISVGALFPLHGPQSALAQQEYAGVEIARDLINQDGGVDGAPVQLDTHELEDPANAADTVGSLRRDGVSVVLGTYSSALSIAASAAAARSGMTYWESGAVADQVTGQGHSQVFRVGASGTNLGRNSAVFAATVLAPRLGREVAATRVSVVLEDDEYGRSVGDSAISAARAAGLDVVSRTTYDAHLPDWPRVLGEVARAHPDVLILASYIPDGISFRRAMLAAGLHVGALIGSTMAECYPDFGNSLGADAIGVFASDRPAVIANPDVLSPPARATYERFSASWRQRMGMAPTEEGIAGFSSAWALFHDVMPLAHDTGAAAIAAAARSVDLPVGSLPNGAGVRFSQDPATLGQNTRAAAVVWQWQGMRHSVTVWPAAQAKGSPTLIPLPR